MAVEACYTQFAYFNPVWHLSNYSYHFDISQNYFTALSVIISHGQSKRIPKFGIRIETSISSRFKFNHLNSKSNFHFCISNPESRYNIFWLKRDGWIKKRQKAKTFQVCDFGSSWTSLSLSCRNSVSTKRKE